MVRPSQEGRVRGLTDAQSLAAGDGTIVGDDGIDIDPGDVDPTGSPGPALIHFEPAAAGTITPDYSDATVWDLTLVDDIDIANAIGWPASGLEGIIKLIIRQDSTGGWVISSWGSAYEFPDTDGTDGGAEPTIHSAAGAITVLYLQTENGGTSVGVSSDGASSGPSPSSLPWFIVTDYGAVGDGSTDDLSSVNDAIGDLNAAGAGVLYFPATADSYYLTDGLDAITVPCTILGDGQGSTIALDHATAVLFTLSANGIRVSGLKLLNVDGSESAGAAIGTTTTHGLHNRYDHLWIEGFYDGMSLIYGWEWTLTECHITNPVRYGIRIASIDLPDAGDWSIANSWVGTRSRTATSGIRIESAGGGKITNVKVNQNSVADQSTYGGAKRYVTGLDVNIQSDTTILLVSNLSVENVSGDAVLIGKTGAVGFKFVVLEGLQVGLYGNNTGYAVKMTNSISKAIIDNLVAKTDGTARAAVSLTSTVDVTLGVMVLEGFNARYTSSGDTGTFDLMAGGVSVALDDLTDVALSSVTTGDVLTFDGADWVNQAPTGGSGNGMIPVDTGTVTYDTSGDPVDVTLETVWGYDGVDPYYDAAGAVAGEEAALYWDPATSLYVLVTFDF